MLAKSCPSCPFEGLAAAVVCHHAGQCYLVSMDFHTDWPNAVPMGKSANTTDLIKSCLHVQQSLTCFGHMGNHSFLPISFNNLPSNEKSNTRCHPFTTGKAETTVKSMIKVLVQLGRVDI